MYGQMTYGMGAADVYGTNANAQAYATLPNGPAVQASVAAGATSNTQATSGAAPAIAWVGILIGLIFIRIAYEQGAKLD